MTSSELLSAIARGAAREGCGFATGRAYALGGSLGPEPAVWVEPPVLKKREGVSEGLHTWSVTVRLVALPDPSADPARQVDDLERRLDGLCRALAGDEDVAGHPETTFCTEEGTLTNRGEISLKATLTVITRF